MNSSPLEIIFARVLPCAVSVGQASDRLGLEK